MNRQLVWLSDEASRAAGKGFALVVVETLICGPIYWLLRWFGITLHHGIIVIAAPLAMMPDNLLTGLSFAGFGTKLKVVSVSLLFLKGRPLWQKKSRPTLF